MTNKPDNVDPDRPFLRLIPWILALIWMGAIFALSSRSRVPDTGLTTETAAIVGHLVAFGMLSVLLAAGLLAIGWSIPGALLGAWIGTVIYGITDEFHQSFVEGRDASLFDVIVDAIGATVVVIVLWIVISRRSHPG